MLSGKIPSPALSSDGNAVTDAVQDRIYSTPVKKQAFRFNESVAGVFSDMVRRSVPGYDDTVALTGVLAGQLAQDHTALYDLGCSLGACTLAMRHAVGERPCHIVGIDNSTAMLDKAQALLEQDHGTAAVQFDCADLGNYEFKLPASLMVMNFTLQFIPTAQRVELLSRINQQLQPGGALILSEKIRFEDEGKQARLTEWHHAFKKAQGYSDLEISQKREALENVLIPDTLETHYQRLEAAGFRDITLWHQSFTFVSLVAFK